MREKSQHQGHVVDGRCFEALDQQGPDARHAARPRPVEAGAEQVDSAAGTAGRLGCNIWPRRAVVDQIQTVSAQGFDTFQDT